MAKKVKVAALLIIMLLVFSISTVQVCSQKQEEEQETAAPSETGYIRITSPSAILIEAKRGQVLYEKQPDTRLHASIANKIMTALVVIEHVKLDTSVTISRESAESDGSILFLKPGEKYVVEDLLYAMMLQSYNDAARALAEFAANNIEDFVSLMNNKAVELNLKNTHFMNPTGLYTQGQYTTARDVSTLTRYAINNESFNRIFSAKSKIWNGNDGLEMLINQNTLFWEYERVDGGKTGFNEQDRYSAVTTASQSQQRIISVVLNAPEEIVFDDSKSLLQYGFENYRLGKLAEAEEVLTSMKIGELEVDLVSLEDIYYTHPVGDDFIMDVGYNLVEKVTLPLGRSQILGTACFLLEDGTQIDVNLFSSVEIPAPESFFTYFKKKLTEHRDILYLLLFLAALECILILLNIFKLMRYLFNLVFSGKKIKNHS